MQAEFLTWVVGEEEVGGGVLPKGVDVSGLDIDARALDLHVDENIAPEVVAHVDGVLMEEKS